MIVPALALRWAHLAACVLVVGSCVALLLAGRSRWPTAEAWRWRVFRWTRGLLLAALATGLGALALQTAAAEGRPAAALEAPALARWLLDTQAGRLWLARHGLLLLLAALAFARTGRERTADWLAGTLETLLLGAGALALLAGAGHAAAVTPGTAETILLHALHLLAAAAWVGALPPLAALLAAAAGPDGADARPFAVLTARRFSRLGLAAVPALVGSGLAAAMTHVGSVAGLLGTPYGRLLLVKLGLVAPMLALGAVNRRRLLPALSGEAERVGRPALRALSRTVAVEAGLGLAVLAVVAGLALTPPARHLQPVWPLSVRLAPERLDEAPGIRLRALAGSQLAVLGLAALLAAGLAGRPRLLLASGTALLAGGLGMALPALAVPAYPTTFQRPPVPYHAASIARGQDLYRHHCAACHDDGPAPDLADPRVDRLTAGDLFWIIGSGSAAGAMPAFTGRLGEPQRWDLVNVIRARGGGRRARSLGPRVEPGRPGPPVPDFSFAVGPLPARSLRDYQGRRAVLLVLYSLPRARPRLAALARSYGQLALLGAEVIAVERGAGLDAIRRLGAEPPVLFPVVTEGGAAIAAALAPFTGPGHVELLIDAQGYLRARWAPAGAPDPDVGPVLAGLETLAAEPRTGPPADEHVH